MHSHGTVHPVEKTFTHSSPSSIWELPLQCGGVILSIHHKSGAHCGSIAVHWAVQSRVASRLLSVRGGVQLHRHHTSRHKGAERGRKTRGPERSKKRGKDCTWSGTYTGKKKRAIDGGRRKKTMVKGLNGSKWCTLLLFSIVRYPFSTRLICVPVYCM